MPKYYHRPKRQEPGRMWLLILTLLVVVVFAVDLVSGGRIRAYVRSGGFVYSFGQSLYSALIQSGIFATRHTLATENAGLKEKVASLTASESVIRALQSENDELRTLIHLAAKKEGVTAPITSSFTSSPYGTFTLGAGRSEGIAIGDIVESSDGFALGRITTADLHTSLAISFFASGESNDALISSVPIVLEGRGGGNARGKAPRDAAITEGDVVLLPSAGGLPIGVVGRIDSGESSAYQDVYISYPVNLGILRFVYVVRS